MKMLRFKNVIAKIIATSVFLSMVTPIKASEESVVDLINGATKGTIATAITEYLTESEKSDLYNILPPCDREEINTRILNSKPYTDYSDLEAAYDKAVKYTTQVDPEKYDGEFTEDFSDIDSGWTQTNIVSGAIGDGRINGTARAALPITEENSSFMFFGGALNPKTANYIERDIENSNSVITMYMMVVNNNALSFSATFDGSQGICLKNTGLSVHALSGVTDTGIDFLSDTWNKIVFDGTDAGVVKCYINGTLAATFNGNITKLNVGTIFNFASYSVIAVDNISIAQGKPAEDYFMKFNGLEVTEETLINMLSQAGVSYEVFNLLPGCDKAEIVRRIEEGRPFSDVTEFKTAYNKAVEYTTQTDADKYVNVWTEDFSKGLDETKWTVVGTLRNNAIGDGVMISGNDLPRKSLNISGNETASAGFVGANFASGMNYITREVAHKSSAVSLYFYDTMWDTKGYFSTFIDEASKYGLGISGDAQYYTKRIGGAWSRTDIERSVGWHKIVFDGLTQPGMVIAYFDGAEVFRSETSITKLTTGNTFADGSYYCAWVDNITVSRKFAPEVRIEGIVDNKTFLEVDYNYTHEGNIPKGEMEFQWYVKNENGKFEEISGATENIYTFKFPDDAGKTFKVSVTPVDINGVSGATVESSEFTEEYMANIRPTVTKAEIVGEVFAGTTVEARYIASNAVNSDKDKYEWFVFEGTEWKKIEGQENKSYTLGTEVIGKKLKFRVSVAGNEGSYSEWFYSNEVSDTTSVIQMISMVKSKDTVGRNQEMLELLKLLDSAYAGYSTGHQQKIVIELFKNTVSTESEYREIVKRVLYENDTVTEYEFAAVDGTTRPIVNNAGSFTGDSKERFTDLGTVEWAREAINALADKNIVSGKEKDKFYPDDNITRAEFVTILVRTFFKTDYSAKQVFTDIDEDEWYSTYIATAYARGIVTGKGNGTFGPHEKITREEMVVMCARVDALGLCDTGEEREYTVFADENTISEYAYDSVVAMYKKSFINGVGENKFAPKVLTTRAMAAKVIFGMINDEERLNSNGQFAVENFETSLGIFKGGHYEDTSVKSAVTSTISYSGTQSLKLLGKTGVYTGIGANRVFRVMIYDDVDKKGKTAMMTVGSLGIGVTTSSKTARLENYSYIVNNSWKDAGITRTTGWHEFIIDMSRVGYVDFYIDGIKIAQTQAEDDVPEYLFIGNQWDIGTTEIYADEFRMARTLYDLNNIKDVGYSNGNKLINNIKINIDNVPEAYREEVEILHALDILAPDENGELNLDEKVTKGQFAYLVSGMMNDSADAKETTGTYFKNIKKDSKYFGYIQYLAETGLVDSESGSFNEDDIVSAEFAAGIMLTLLGYSDVLEGGEDTKWFNEANAIGLFEDTGALDGGLTNGDAIRLCYNTLLTNVLEVKYSNGDFYSFTESDDITFLNYYFDVYIIDDYINGVYGAELSDKKVLNENELLLGNLVVKNYDNEFCRYNGMKVRALICAPESDDITLAYVYNRNRSSEITVSASDIVSAKSNSLQYYSENRTKYLKYDSNLKVVYNGSYLFGYTDENLMPEIGYVRFVDSDDDNVYDIAFVVDYDAVKIKAVDGQSKILHDEYTDTVYNFKNADLITSGIYNNFSVEKLTVGQVILFAISADEKRVDILSDMQIVEGSISSIEDDIIVIDEVQYNRIDALDKYNAKKGLAGLTIGASGEFTIDIFGNIIGINSSSSSNQQFGYIIQAWQDVGFGDYYIKMYLDSGKVQILSVDKNMRLYDEKGKLQSIDNVVTLSPQLVRIKTKGDGSISVLECAKTDYKNTDTLKGSDDFWLFRDDDVWYRDNGYHFGLALRIAKDTPVMFVPDAKNTNNEKLYSMGTYSSFSNGQTFDYKAYNADEYNFPDIILVEATAGARPLKSNESPMFVVEKIVTGLNEAGDVTAFLHGYENGVEKVYEQSDDITFEKLKQDAGYTKTFEAGDTFIPLMNTKGQLAGLWYIVRMQEEAANYDDLSVWNFVFDEISCCYAMIESYGRALKITDGVKSTVIGAPEKIFVYSLKGKTLSAGSAAELIPGRDIAIRTTHGNTREVIVFVD